jgi:hypothetical protein
VFTHVHMPSLGGATEWLDSAPLGPAELRDHVVVVDFWILTCINWLRTEPYIAPGRRPTETTGWSSRRPHARVLVRAPDRPHPAGDQGARIDYPSRVDNDYAIWSAFDTTTGRRCTSSTPTASAATTTSAKDATSNPSAPSSGCSVERELLCVEGLGVLIGVLGFHP